jgi:glycogen debranching enzyme
MNRDAHESADAVGWLFFRAQELFAGDNSTFPHHSEFSIKKPLEAAIEGLLDKHTNKEGFAVNGPGETWMDAIYKGDDRSGVRLEVQVLRLNMYRLAYELTQKRDYKKLEKGLKEKVRDSFWTGDYLQDGKEDSTIRPNIFLAYYLYPKLLSEKQWKSCFDTALKHLWCDWGKSRNIPEENRGTPQNYSAKFCDQVPRSSAPLGGLATIDKNHPLFCPEHTGENPKSYHRGDSWFWLNNLAAISMLRLDSEHYKGYIRKIINASVLDLFGGQIPGHSSELSSASSFSPAGSPCQAWSEATLIELIDELQSQNFVD